ncbi:hypothetical protein TNCV_3798921 [Trichonephila clavipes]|nr:hypothetical protein TNCV_3798921 [Trichonephila clavipes]
MWFQLALNASLPSVQVLIGVDGNLYFCLWDLLQLLQTKNVTNVEWAPNEIAVVPDFHKRILFSDEAHFWWNGYVNKQNCRIWSEANP